MRTSNYDYFDFIWLAIMLFCFCYFGWHIAGYFHSHLYQLIGALGGPT